MIMLGDCQGCNGKGRFADPYYKQFAPRVGFAWTPGDEQQDGHPRRLWHQLRPADRGWMELQLYGYGFDGTNPIYAYTNSRFLEDPSYSWDTRIRRSPSSCPTRIRRC